MLKINMEGPARFKDIYGKILIGAIVVILFIPFFIFFISPQLTQLPSDFNYKADISSIDNLYDESKQQFSGEIHSNTRFSYQTHAIKNGILEIQNSFEVAKPSGEQIFAVKRLYGIDPKSGKHVKGHGDKNRDGYLFAPRNLHKQDFIYWHVNYDTPAYMKFQGEEKILNLTVYRYETNYHADQTKDLGYLPEVGKTRGVNLDINLKLWVEPLTGRMIKYEDSTTAYYYDLKTGKRLFPWNKFSNTFTSSSVASQVNIAEHELRRQLIIEKAIPVLLAVLGISLLVLAYIARRQKGRAILPFFFLFISLVTVYFSWQFSVENNNNQAKAQFDSETTYIINQLQNRLAIYSNTLQGSRGLFESSVSVDRSEWQSYIRSINLQKNYPGIQSIGFMPVIGRNDLPAYITQVKTNGLAEYTVFPPGQRQIYTPIIYIEPYSNLNKKALGYDMFQDPTRREGMEQARDQNKAVISKKVKLVQEPVNQAGFLMFVPVYKKNVAIETIDQRRHAIEGYVFGQFRMNDLMKEVLENQSSTITINVFDGTESSISKRENELYTNSEKDTNSHPKFTAIKTIDIYGHPLTITFASTPDYGLSIFEESLPNIFLFGGIIFSLLVFATVYALNSSGARAVILAAKMTEYLKNKSNELETSNRQLATEIAEKEKSERSLIEKTNDLERINKVMLGRELKMIELKKQLEDYKKKGNPA